MTTATVALFAPHRGRRARPGLARRAARALTATHYTAAAGVVVVAAVAGLLLGTHPYARHQAVPRCVAWHTCGCRFPGSGRWPGNNQLCRINWGTPAGARP
jgi:hypothetical protein